MRSSSGHQKRTLSLKDQTGRRIKGEKEIEIEIEIMIEA
jgi:hypothetical protein